jgi:hypothetical protein
VTLVIVLQLLLASLVGLLLLERRLNDLDVPAGDDSTGPIDFHPELIIRWDDEADYARTDVCARRSIAPRPAMRRVPSASDRRTHQR